MPEVFLEEMSDGSTIRIRAGFEPTPSKPQQTVNEAGEEITQSPSRDVTILRWWGDRQCGGGSHDGFNCAGCHAGESQRQIGLMKRAYRR